MLSYEVGDVVQFKAGGRFTGNKVCHVHTKRTHAHTLCLSPLTQEWEDGATLTLNEIDSIKLIDIKEKWPYHVRFDHVYVMLMEADIAAAPEPRRSRGDPSNARPTSLLLEAKWQPRQRQAALAAVS